jgi:hypothetical protein
MGHEKQPRQGSTSTGQQVPATSTLNTTNGDSQDLLGNQAVQNLLAGDGPQCVDANTIPWEDTGNIRGTPPVRNRESSPNHNVVEDQANYAKWRGDASSALSNLRAKTAEGGPLLDSAGEVTDARYWFAKVYTHVTENELIFAAQSTYNYPTYVMASVAYFERLYSDNFNAWDRQQTEFEQLVGDSAEESVDALVAQGVAAGIDPVEPHWAEVFEDGLDNDHDDIEDAASALLSSMKAHIRFDLPRAEAWVFQTLYASDPCTTVADFRPDFFAMTGVFENASEAMTAEMLDKTDWEESMLTRLGMVMPRTIQDWGMGSMPIFGQGVDMGTERVDTWRRAELLSANGAGQDPYAAGGSGDVTTSDNLTPLTTATADSGLLPTMGADTNALDDDLVNDNLASMTDNQVRALSVTQKARYVEGLLTGSVVDGDEGDILRVLRLSGSQIVTVVNAVEAWELGYKLDGDEYKTLRSLLRTSYYGRCDQNTALAIIRRCMDGETAEWEEQMVADLLVDRTDGRALLIRIGKIYDDTALAPMVNALEADGQDVSSYDDTFFTRGLNKVLWQLDGEDDTRVRAVYGSA